MASKSMSKRYCSVPQCNNYVSGGISIHQFPNEENLKSEWKRVLKIGKPISRYMAVCSAHFLPDDFSENTQQGFREEGIIKRRRLKKNVVPSQKIPILRHAASPLEKTPVHLPRAKSSGPCIKVMAVDDDVVPSTSNEPEHSSNFSLPLHGYPKGHLDVRMLVEEDPLEVIRFDVSKQPGSPFVSLHGHCKNPLDIQMPIMTQDKGTQTDCEFQLPHILNTDTNLVSFRNVLLMLLEENNLACRC